MSGLTLNARRKARLPVAKLGLPSQSELIFSQPEPEPVKPPITAFEHMANRNPAFGLLVETMDLVEVWSTGSITPTPLPELPGPIMTGPTTPKLKQLAQQAFRANQTYTEEEAIGLLASLANVTIDRARNGLAMMQSQNLIALTLSSEFYLSDSTPF